MNPTTRRPLENFKVPVKLKLSALWISVMFCYIYGDYFGLYVPGALKSMLDGQMGPLGPTTQGILLGTTALMVIPCLMPFLSLLLKPSVNRPVNVFFGLVYSTIMLVTMPGAWVFYQALAVVEILLTGLVVWYAWKWPRMPENAQEPARGDMALSAPPD